MDLFVSEDDKDQLDLYHLLKQQLEALWAVS